MKQTACAVTGHRPTRFRFKYNEDYSLCKKLKRSMLEQFKKLYDEQGVGIMWAVPRAWICGPVS